MPTTEFPNKPGKYRFDWGRVIVTNESIEIEIYRQREHSNGSSRSTADRKPEQPEKKKEKADSGKDGDESLLMTILGNAREFLLHGDTGDQK